CWLCWSRWTCWWMGPLWKISSPTTLCSGEAPISGSSMCPKAGRRERWCCGAGPIRWLISPGRRAEKRGNCYDTGDRSGDLGPKGTLCLFRPHVPPLLQPDLPGGCDGAPAAVQAGGTVLLLRYGLWGDQGHGGGGGIPLQGPQRQDRTP